MSALKVCDCLIIMDQAKQKFVFKSAYPVSILYKSITGCYRPVRVADGPITVRYRFIKNASWVSAQSDQGLCCQ